MKNDVSVETDSKGSSVVKIGADNLLDMLKSLSNFLEGKETLNRSQILLVKRRVDSAIRTYKK
jgi:hypothetical protein